MCNIIQIILAISPILSSLRSRYFSIGGTVIQDILTDDTKFLIFAYTLMFLWIVFVLTVGIGLTKKYENAKYFQGGVYGIAAIFFFVINLSRPTFKGIVYDFLYLLGFYFAFSDVWGNNNSKENLKPEDLDYSIMDIITEGEEDVEWKEEKSLSFLLFMTFVWTIGLYLGSYLILIHFEEIQQKINVVTHLNLNLSIHLWFFYSYYVLQFLIGLIGNIFRVRNRFAEISEAKDYAKSLSN